MSKVKYNYLDSRRHNKSLEVSAEEVRRQPNQENENARKRMITHDLLASPPVLLLLTNESPTELFQIEQ